MELGLGPDKGQGHVQGWALGVIQGKGWVIHTIPMKVLTKLEVQGWERVCVCARMCTCARACEAVNLSCPAPSKNTDSPLRRVLPRKIATPTDKHTLVSVQTHPETDG